MKKIKLFTVALLLGICVTMPMFLVGCGGIDYSHVRAFIHEDYHDKFDNMEFAIEDFEWDNISSFEYRVYYDIPVYDELEENKKDENGEYVLQDIKFLVIKLKTITKMHAEQARQHLETLEFVEYTTFHHRSADPGRFYDKDDKVGGNAISNNARVSIESVTKEMFDTATIKSVEYLYN